MRTNGQRDDQRYRLLVEQATDIVFTLGLDGNFTSVNPAGERLSGYTREEVLALNLADVVTPEHLNLAREMIRRKVMGEVESTRYPLAILTKDGRRVELEVSTWMIRRDGEQAEIQGIARDVTEREQAGQALRESEARYRRLAEQAPDIIYRYEVQPEQRLVYVSRAATAVLGYPPEAFYANPELALRLIHIEDVRLACRMAEAEESAVPTVLRCRHRDGHTVWMELRTTLVRDRAGTLVSIEGIGRDITERERLLASERAARAEAEAALQARDQFLSSAAHELRTPLATISAYVDLLEGATEHVQPDDVRGLDVIRRQSLRLRRLVDELVDVSRLDLGRLELFRRRFELGELASDILREMQSISPKHRLVLEREAPVWVEADGYRIEQVLLNLLSNAIKHSPEGSNVTVRIGVHDGKALVGVRDEGMGIPAEHQGRLFERFYRVHTDGSAGIPGIGLGLFISREFIERHGGRIWCESAEGRGSTFSFTVPLGPQSSP